MLNNYVGDVKGVKANLGVVSCNVEHANSSVTRVRGQLREAKANVEELSGRLEKWKGEVKEPNLRHNKLVSHIRHIKNRVDKALSNVNHLGVKAGSIEATIKERIHPVCSKIVGSMDGTDTCLGTGQHTQRLRPLTKCTATQFHVRKRVVALKEYQKLS